MKFTAKYIKLIIKIFLHAKVILKTWYWLLKFLIRHKINNTTETLGSNGITLVITACNRPNKLKATLESFFQHCSDEFEKVIFIEDGGSSESVQIAKSFFNTHKNFISILNEKNIGQLNSIDLAYSHIETEWIFHMEEDWLFVKGDFIKHSINVMSQNRKILFLSLRSKFDQNNHPLKEHDNGWLTYKPFWKLVWVGFGFNPSLRRLSHYRLIGSSYGKWNFRETSIGLFYFFKGFKILVNKDDIFYIKHNGSECSTYLKYKKA